MPGFTDLGFARVDTDRKRRCGFPEVIFCEGKTPEEVAAISKAVLAKDCVLLGTRASRDHFTAVHEIFPEATFHDRARCITVEKKRRSLNYRGQLE